MNLNDAPTGMPASTPMLMQSEPFVEPASDGHPIGGFTWRHVRTDVDRRSVRGYYAVSVQEMLLPL